MGRSSEPKVSQHDNYDEHSSSSSDQSAVCKRSAQLNPLGNSQPQKPSTYKHLQDPFSIHNCHQRTKAFREQQRHSSPHPPRVKYFRYNSGSSDSSVPPEKPHKNQQQPQLKTYTKSRPLRMGDKLLAMKVDETSTGIVESKSTLPSAVEPEDVSKLSGTVFLDQYKLLEKLGSGAFGVIYKTKDLKHEGSYYGCKVERAETKHPQVIFEARLYNFLHNNINRPAVGIPRCLYFARHGEFNIMIMELLGISLEQAFNQSNRRFGLKTVLMLADQLISRVEYLHTRNFIHRDIKPDNFLLAKRFLKDTEHIPYKDGKNLTGTARYASINTHVGIEQSRRDDLESLGYMFVYFLKGQLPWQNIRAKEKKEKYEKIKTTKQQTKVEDLCSGLPTEFIWYINYTKQLEFTDKPDYAQCKEVFKKLMARNNFEYDNIWDWTKERQEERQFQGSQKKMQQPISSIPEQEGQFIFGNIAVEGQCPQTQFSQHQGLMNPIQPLAVGQNYQILQQQQQLYQQQQQLANQQTRAKYYGNPAIDGNREQLETNNSLRVTNQQQASTLSYIPHQQYLAVNQPQNSPRRVLDQVDVLPQQLPEIYKMSSIGSHIMNSGGKGQTSSMHDSGNPSMQLSSQSYLEQQQISSGFKQNQPQQQGQSSLAKQGNMIINNSAQLNYYQIQSQQMSPGIAPGGNQMVPIARMNNSGQQIPVNPQNQQPINQISNTLGQQLQGSNNYFGQISFTKQSMPATSMNIAAQTLNRNQSKDKNGNRSNYRVQ